MSVFFFSGRCFSSIDNFAVIAVVIGGKVEAEKQSQMMMLTGCV